MSETSIDKPQEPDEVTHNSRVSPTIAEPFQSESGSYITQVPLTDEEQTLERELLEHFGPQGCHDCND